MLTPKQLLSLSVVAAAVLIAAGCQTQPAVTGEPPPSTPVWFVGDSLAHGTSASMSSGPFRAGMGASGFTSAAFSSVTYNTNFLLDLHGAQPELILAMAGVNDLSRSLADADDIIAGMQVFEQAMAARGIPVRFVMQPRWTYTELDRVNVWLAEQRPDAIDCRSSAGPSVDRIHPSDYTAFARCVDGYLA